jgi:hypothetical protein
MPIEAAKNNTNQDLNSPSIKILILRNPITDCCAQVLELGKPKTKLLVLAFVLTKCEL